MSILSPAQLAAVAKAAPCPACRVLEELRKCGPAGAFSKATAIRKSKTVRAVFAHTCQGEAVKNG